jgi:hypothetical protein
MVLVRCWSDTTPQQGVGWQFSEVIKCRFSGGCKAQVCLFDHLSGLISGTIEQTALEIGSWSLPPSRSSPVLFRRSEEPAFLPNRDG